MTEKRFYLMNVEDPLHEYGRWCKPVLEDGVTGKQYESALEVMDLLNSFNEENGQLKKILGFLKNDNAEDILNVLNSQENKICELKQKNVQLKQFQDRVFSWIDMHLQRLPTLRDDEFESDNEFADPSLYSGAIQILETMKRELKGDAE